MDEDGGFECYSHADRKLTLSQAIFGVIEPRRSVVIAQSLVTNVSRSVTQTESSLRVAC